MEYIRTFISNLSDKEVTLISSFIGALATVIAATLAVAVAFNQLKKQLELKVIEEAWQNLQRRLFDLSHALSDYETKIQGLTYYLKSRNNPLVNGGDLEKHKLNKWQEVSDSYIALQHAHVKFLIAYESYEIMLLPICKIKKLLWEVFDNKVFSPYMDFMDKVFPEMAGIQDQLDETTKVTAINKYWGDMAEVSVYIDDFRREIQNLTVGKILKKSVPKRVPEDKKYKVLTRNGYVSFEGVTDTLKKICKRIQKRF